MVTLWLTVGLISSGTTPTTPNPIPTIPDNTTQIVTVGFLLLR